MLIPRPYQEEAVQSIFDHFSAHTSDPLVVLPTACGKSLVIAEFIRRATTLYPGTRIIVATHVKELVAQNHAEFANLCPEIPSGLYSAGLKRRDTGYQVLFCGIQSVFRRALELGACDILLIDEAHLVPKKGEGMWRTFIQNLRIPNPLMKIVGLSATPFRLDTGMLHKGEGRIFEDICYDYPLLEAIENKYVSEVIPKNMDTKYDVSNVPKRGGEYVAGELERVYDVDEKTKAAVDEIIELGKDRKSWLIFAAGNKHAKHLHEELILRGISSELVLQDTPSKQRDEAVRKIKTGEIRCLVNNLVFTTGFNAPNIDMIACFRSTQSAGLWVQIVGRGFRLAEGKENCLVLDFARNADRHGPLDQIKGHSKRKGEGGDAPIKNCPECHAVCFASARECPDCGYSFPPPELDISTKASTSAILSTQLKPEWHEVLSVAHSRHVKNGNASMKVEYITLGGKFYEFICFEHGGYAKEMAARWHRKKLPDVPCPHKVEDALMLPYPAPSRIAVRKDGKYWRVVEHSYEEAALQPPPTTMLTDDIIPF